MKKALVFLLAWIMLLSLAATVSAATGGELYDGDNEIELPWKAKEASVFTYTATQTGTLYITATTFEYSYKGAAYKDNSANMSDWAGTRFTVDGQRLEYSYYGSVQVVQGQTYTISWEHLFVGNFGWRATLNLSYTDDAQPKQGSKEAPVKLYRDDCPKDTVLIEAGEIAYYELYEFDGASLSVTGGDAYVLMTIFDVDAFVSVDYRYEAKDGVVTAPIPTDYIVIQIGNSGDTAQSFQLNWFYPEGTRKNPAELTNGENVATTQQDNYEGYYFRWTAQCSGKLILTFPETGWMYSVYNQTSGEKIENIIYGDAGVSNIVEIAVSKGDELLLNVNSFKRTTVSVPGGDVVFTATEVTNHHYGEPVITQPTDCKHAGSEVSTCTLCGDQQIVIIPGAHSVDEVFPGREATCAENGILPYWHCGICDTYFADEVLSQPSTLEELAIPSLEHTYVVSGTTEGSCVIESTTMYSCSVCGHSYTESGEFNADQHGQTEVKNASEATCTMAGYTGDTCCADCGKVIERGEAIAAKGHSYACTATTPGTCVIKSTSTYTCGVCGDQYTEAGSLDPENHAQTELKNIVEATCTTAGYTGDTCCTGCGKVMQVGAAMEAKGHSYACTGTTEGTCLVKSTATYTCSACDHSYTESGDLNPDQHGQIVLQNASEATCTAAGYTGDGCCADCGKIIETGEAVAAKGHSMECTNVVAGTCITKSTSTYACSVCSYSYIETGTLDEANHVNTQTKGAMEATCLIDGYTGNQVCNDCGAMLAEGQVIPAVGHRFGQWTTTDDGRYNRRTCGVCGYEETEDLGCQHRNTQITGAVEATCTTAGYTGDTCCADCGKVMQTGTGVPANGHSYTCTATTPGSCIVKSTNTYTCSVCAEQYTEAGELDPEKHGKTEVKNASEATCTTAGYSGDTCCADCGKVIEAGVTIAAKDHSYACTAEIPGTCVIKGTITYTCSVCGHSYTEAGEVNTDQHGKTEVNNTSEATCTTDGYTGDTCCADCGKVIESGASIAAKGHSYACTATTQGTCVVKSTSTYTCSVCDHSYVESGKLDENHHVNTYCKGAIEATCLIDGYTGDEMCSDCGMLLISGQVIPAEGHRFGEWTTTDDGRYQSRVCEICGQKETEDLGCAHSQTQITGTVEATCTTAGYTGDTCCADCGKIMQAGTGVPAKGHSYVCTATTPGTCVVKSTSTYTCSVCHYSYTEAGDVNAQQHRFGEWITGDDGTYQTRICVDCSHEEVQQLQCAHGETQRVDEKEATCVTDGHTGNLVCTACGEIVTRGETITAIGHAFGAWTTTRKPTATTDGQRMRQCETCGEQETEEIPATGAVATEPSAQPTQPTQSAATQPTGNTGDKAEDGLPVMIIVILAVVIAGVAVAAVIFWKKKN